MKTIVSEKGQITIPKELRDRLGIQPGQVLEFSAENGKLVAIKVLPQDALEQVYGILKGTPGTDTLLTELRGPAV